MSVWKRVCFLVLFFYAYPSSADRFCFALAASYYEQVYCEVMASGKGADLPPLYEFQRNNERMQGLLLKRYAQRIGINLIMPTAPKAKRKDKAESAVSMSSTAMLEGCDRNMDAIICGRRIFRLIGNKPNQQLSSNVLTESNVMGLPHFVGSVDDDGAVNNYLANSYQHYLQKMIDIGLGGATLSYGKFAYLFDDLNNKGISFTGRFETMYRFLKKDKLSMNVPLNSTVPNDLSIDDCYRLDALLICRAGMRNWLFQE